MNLVEWMHERGAKSRRARVLAAHAGRLIEGPGTVLDVGCGDGAIAALLQRSRPDLTVSGVDTLVRPGAAIPVTPFDGRTLPFGDGAFGTVLLFDVLHHTDDAGRLLVECARAAAEAIVLKDHLADGWGSAALLRYMDRVGNRRHGVASPGNYLTRAEWAGAFARAGVAPVQWTGRVGLYPWPASLVFDRTLQFVCRLEPLAHA
jgi:SAM-dependent methyltransferase